MFEQTAPDENHLYIGMVEKLRGDGWTVGNDRRLQFQGNMAGNLPGGCSTIQHDHLSRLNQLRCCPADGYFAIRGYQFASGKIYDCRRRGKSAAMHPLQQSFLCHLAQVAADRIFRNAHLLAYFFRDDLALQFEDGEDLLFPVSGQHGDSSHNT